MPRKVHSAQVVIAIFHVESVKSHSQASGTSRVGPDLTVLLLWQFWFWRTDAPNQEGAVFGPKGVAGCLDILESNF